MSLTSAVETLVNTRHPSSDALPKFPIENERTSFPDWLIRAEIFFSAKGMTDVVDHPLANMPEMRSGVFIYDPNVTYIGYNSDGTVMSAAKLEAIEKRSRQAFNYITQALPDKHLELVKSVYIGNAYMLMVKLKSTFGVIKSAVSTVVMYQKLYNNRKLASETMNDYFSRVDSMVRDLQNLGATVEASLKKFWLYNGLMADSDWSSTITVLNQLDMGATKSIEEIKEYLVTQEDQKRALRASSDTSNHHDTVNNTEKQTALASTYRGGRGRGRGRGRDSNRGGHRPSSDTHHHQHQHSRGRGRGRGHIHGRGRGSYRGRGGSYSGDRETSSKVCHHCNKPGHVSSECYSNKSNGVECYACGKYGHYASDCFSRKRQGGDSDSYDQQAQVSSSSSSSSSPSFSDDTQTFKRNRVLVVTSYAPSLALQSLSAQPARWILDSGATDHYTCNLSLLHDIVTLSTPHTIYSANGVSTCTTIGKATITINDTDSFTLSKVYYLPDFHHNLISVARVTDNGADIVYNHKSAIITSDGQFDIHFPRVDNLYVFTAAASTALVSSSSTSQTHVSPVSHSPSSSNSSSNVSPPPVITPLNYTSRTANEIYLLHLKLNHLNYYSIIKMVNKHSVTLTNAVSNNAITHQNQLLNELRSRPCPGCLKGKMKRTAMTGKIQYFIDDIMDLWVFDTVIVNRKTLGGCNYITTIIDVYSSKIFVALHKHKDDIESYLIRLITVQQTQKGLKLKRIHSDNGTEVCTNVFFDFISNNGTIHTTTVTYTPTHNSMVERKHRTLLEAARSAMIFASAPYQMYGECVTYCAHTLDRSLNTRHDSKTPLEQWDDRKPNITYLHVWGCDASVYVHKHERAHKFDAKAKTGIFIGVDELNETYYLILDVDTMKVTRTRDVVFNETSFEEMKKLSQQIDNDISIDKETLNDVNNYLPDTLFNTSEAVASMFNGEAVPTNNINDIETESSSTRPHETESSSIRPEQQPSLKRHNIDVINTSSSSSSPSSSSSKRQKQHTPSERKSTRVTAIPDRLAMLLSSSSPSSCVYRMDPNDYAMLVLDEPMSYKQAMQCEERVKWQQAMDEELDAHRKNSTWRIVDKTDDMNVIGCRWVYKVKRDAEGQVSRYKARLVAKGYNQQYGIDFHDTFAPVLKYKTLRIMIVLALHYDMCMEQLDVKTAFLNASVKENIYIEVPEGMSVKSGCVLKLLKALYGIKQAPREWHEEIDRYLHQLGYTSCIKDSCVYWKKTRTHRIIMLGLFVDDITSLYHHHDKAEWVEDRTKLKSKYDLNELGELHHILGMNVTRTSSSTVTIRQDTYIKDKLNLFNFEHCNDVPTPGISTTHIDTNTSPTLSPPETQTYQMMVGSLIYASISTRPDITHATNMVARHMGSPTQHNMTMVKRIFRYLSGHRSAGLTYIKGSQRDAVELTGYCDADWGGDKSDRKSTTGYCTLMNTNLISWQTKKQTTVAHSTAEAEYMAISDVARELMWMRQLLTELGVSIVTPSIIYSDNQPAIRISENDSDHDRTKHIDIKHHFIRNLVKDKVIQLKWISTHDQLADMLTKALGTQTFISLRDRLMHPTTVNRQ